MSRLLLGIFKDLYIVLLVVLVVENIPGTDLLHDMTRKGVITVTICVVLAKILQPLMDGCTAGGPVRSPKRQKKTEGGAGGPLKWAVCEMQGWRPAMEDATCVVSCLSEPLRNQALFAVFDGHGGAQVSEVVSREFPKVLTACAKRLERCDGKQLCHSSSEAETAKGSASELASEPADEDDGLQSEEEESMVFGSPAPSDTSFAGRVLHHALLTMDAFLRKAGASSSAVSKANWPRGLGLVAQQLETTEKRNAFNLVGSTAIVVLIDCGRGSGSSDTLSGTPVRLSVANCGDSRAVLCRAGKAVELSEDHKPELPKEEERIRRAGGHVTMIGPCHRIDGWGLNLSRALGDFHYKARSDLPPEQQKVSAEPEIRTLDLTPEDEFLVLGCDGIFELHTSQQAVDIVRAALKDGQSVEKAVEDLVDRSCSSNLMKTHGKGGDNCSAIVVKLK